MKKDLLTLRDLSREEILTLIQRAMEIKRGKVMERPFVGKVLGLIFVKASTRTRVSFQTAMYRLGGSTIFMTGAETQVSRNEPIRDTARVLSRYLDILAVRTFKQEEVEEMAAWAEIPVINALTDLYHPCQILSDMMTVKERLGRLEDIRVAWVGDGNNVANSWINAAAIVGFNLVVACPEGYEPYGEALSRAGDNVKVVRDPREAVEGADVINTDVWASMGQEKEAEQRRIAFKGYQVTSSLLDRAKKNALVMHCLPAHRGEEIAEEVLEGPNSVVFDQAENKMHLHQALLEAFLLSREGQKAGCKGV
jgi:ornithine carbamoyltransferase